MMLASRRSASCYKAKSFESKTEATSGTGISPTKIVKIYFLYELPSSTKRKTKRKPEIHDPCLLHCTDLICLNGKRPRRINSFGLMVHGTQNRICFSLYSKRHRGTKGTLLFFQKTRTLQSRGVVTLFHLFTIAIYGRNCFDMQH